MWHVNLLISLSLFLSTSVQAMDGWVAAVYSPSLQGGADSERGIQAQLRHSAEWSTWQLKMNGRYRWNQAACDNDPAVCQAYRLNFDWRELYISNQLAGWTLSAGQQQVVWGKADNLRVFDLVNPLDLRDYVLPDLNDYRIAVPMLRGNRNLGDWMLEAVFIPRFKPNRYAVAGSVYDLGIEQQFAAAGLPVMAYHQPDNRLRNGEFGAVLSTTRDNVDWSLLAFSTWSDDPVYRFDFSNPVQPGVVAEYRRQNVLGVSNAWALDGGWIARSELTWSPNASYTRQLNDVTQNSTINVLLGLDYSWWNWLLSGQISDRRISGWQQDFLLPEHQAFVTFSATGTHLDGKLATRLALTVMPQNGDGSWLQWRSSYKFTDTWQLEGTLNLLDGKQNGYLGQFRHKDQLRLELRQYF